jgi:hypothetical protein
MAGKLKIPKWSGLTQMDLERVDLGARIKPITRSEAESGLLLRGPVVLSAVPETSDGGKRQLPVIMTNVRLLEENNRFFIEYTGSPYRVTEFHIRPRIRPTVGGLLRGDLEMFTIGNGSGETELRPFLEGFWDN